MEVSPEGLFNLPVALPPEALAVTEVWYELGIDSDTPADDDATDDMFPERIRVHSVPFALEAGEVAHVDADHIGTGTVDNTAFAQLAGVTGPIQTAIDGKANAAALTAHENDTSNPHAVSAAQVGLDAVDNTSDLAKPISTATQTALDAKANTARDDQYVFSTTNVLIQTASDVRVENLLLHYTGSSTTTFAYRPNVTWNDGTTHTGSPPETHIRNCEFMASERGMRDSVEYAGVYENCAGGGEYTFGGLGTASGGKFYYCTGGSGSFTTTGSPTVLYCVRDNAAYP